jgi:hypothetical protein
VGYAPAAGPAEPSAAFAIVSLVTGIVALVMFWCIGWILAIVSIVFGVIALNKVKNGTGKGKGMAIAGIICAALSFVAWASILIAFRN